jgi:hypothetical protein
MRVASVGSFGRNWSATLRAFCGFGVALREGGGDEGGDDVPAALSGMGERIAHEVDAAPPPSRLQNRGDRSLQPFVRVELDARETPSLGTRPLDVAYAWRGSDVSGEFTQRDR